VVDVGNDRNIANWGAFAVAAHDVLGWEGGKFETRAGAEDRLAYPACLCGFRRARVRKRKMILACALPVSADQSLGWLKQLQGL
jgi:hypothetical protein